MKMKDVLVVQNSSIEDSGNLGKLLQSDGFTLHSVFAKKEKLPFGDYSLLVVLGGPNSANDESQYLLDEQKLIGKFMSKKKPVLGICLGSQLIAKSCGGKVYPGHKKEIGFFLAWSYILDSTGMFTNNPTKPVKVEA